MKSTGRKSTILILTTLSTLSNFIMATAVCYYKSITRRICRLPLDIKSLNLLQLSVRDAFRTHKPAPTYSIVNRKDYDRLSNIIDDILKKNKYRELPTLLDFIYKDRSQLERWKAEFVTIRYNRWKSTWPQIHLIREFGKSKHISAYDRELRQMDGSDFFSILKELNLLVPEDLPPISPICCDSSEPRLDGIFKEIEKFHQFLKKNSNLIMTVKLLPLEVTYEPSRVGLPLSVAAREKKLRSKITYMKQLCREFRPLPQEVLDHLILVATDQLGPELTINPNFYRYSKRIHEKLPKPSPLERKYLLQKQLIPDSRNIRFHYRSYVTRQFSISNGNYTMSPMKNFYD